MKGLPYFTKQGKLHPTTTCTARTLTSCYVVNLIILTEYGVRGGRTAMECPENLKAKTLWNYPLILQIVSAYTLLNYVHRPVLPISDINFEEKHDLVEKNKAQEKTRCAAKIK